MPVLLADPRVTVELVPDGVHVHPLVLDLAVRTAGPQRVAMVTDAIPAAGLPDGRHELGGLPIEVRGGVPRGASGALAGSTTTMDAVFRTALHARRAAGVGEHQALLDAVTMTAGAPARALGLDGVGELRPGGRADLVVLDADLAVGAVMRAGLWAGSGLG